MKYGTTAKISKRDRSTSGVLALGIVLLAMIAAAGLWYTYSQGNGYRDIGSPVGGGRSIIGGENRAYSYYHDQYFDSDSYSPHFRKNSLLNRDDDERQYDGPYDYGSYGSTGMRERADAKDSRPDAVLSTPGYLQGVFDRYGDPDPSGGAPVGDPSLGWYATGYDPFAGYSNPYSNRIRLSYGPGAGRGAYSGDVLRVPASSTP